MKDAVLLFDRYKSDVNKEVSKSLFAQLELHVKFPEDPSILQSISLYRSLSVYMYGHRCQDALS